MTAWELEVSKSVQYDLLRRAIRTLLNSPRKVVVLKAPADPAEYLEPTYGQCLALQLKDKVLILEQPDGSYLHLVAKDGKIHRSKASEEEVQKLLTD